jgi:hypothetical protein
VAVDAGIIGIEVVPFVVVVVAVATFVDRVIAVDFCAI